jgi:hypothetical protein
MEFGYLIDLLALSAEFRVSVTGDKQPVRKAEFHNLLIRYWTVSQEYENNGERPRESLPGHIFGVDRAGFVLSLLVVSCCRPGDYTVTTG